MGDMVTPQVSIGFYGLGSMGLGMAKNLAAHLKATNAQPLKYSNRTLSKGDELKTMGATEEKDFSSLVGACDVVFTMISNDQVLKELTEEALTCGTDLTGKLFVDTSTVHPDTSAFVSEKFTAAGAQFLAAPVFGASAMAATGKLIFAIAGPPAAVGKVEPLIQDVMGRSIIKLGEDVKKSSLLKITGNCMVIGLQQLISETHIFAEASGLTTPLLHQFITDMYGPTCSGYSARLTTGAYAPPLEGEPGSTPPGFAIDLSIKDARHAVSLAQSHGVFLPTMDLALRNMISARAYAGSWLDSSALYGTMRQWAGMGFWNEKSRKG